MFPIGLPVRAGLGRVTDEDSLLEIAQYCPYYLPGTFSLLPKALTFIFYLFVFTSLLLFLIWKVILFVTL